MCTCIECTQEENPGPLEGRNAVCWVLGCLAPGVPVNPGTSGVRWRRGITLISGCAGKSYGSARDLRAFWG